MATKAAGQALDEIAEAISPSERNLVIASAAKGFQARVA
jgi:hypothetical protein